MRNTITDVAVRIVGQDEIDPKKNYISWTSPLAKNLLGKVIGDIFKFNTPNGVDEIEVLDVNYN